MPGGKLKIRVAEVEDFSQSTISFLQGFASVEIKPCHQSELASLFEQIDVFWFRLGFVIDSSVITKNTRLKIIATPVTGIDHIDEELCERNNIKIVCLRGEYDFLKQIRATAEHTIGLTLAILRKIVPASNSVSAGIWNRDLFRGSELYGKTIGILGYGRLGKIVADYFYAFDCKIVAFDIKKIQPKQGSNVDIIDNLDSFLSKCDILSIHINYTPENINLVDSVFLSKLPSNTILINTSRGGVIDEEALLRALENKTIKGAAIDVIKNESNFSPNNPLIKFAAENDNLLITPHIGGNTYESFEKTEMFLANKIKDILRND